LIFFKGSLPASCANDSAKTLPANQESSTRPKLLTNRWPISLQAKVSCCPILTSFQPGRFRWFQHQHPTNVEHKTVVTGNTTFFGMASCFVASNVVIGCGLCSYGGRRYSPTPGAGEWVASTSFPQLSHDCPRVADPVDGHIPTILKPTARTTGTRLDTWNLRAERVRRESECSGRRPRIAGSTTVDVHV